MGGLRLPVLQLFLRDSFYDGGLSFNVLGLAPINLGAGVNTAVNDNGTPSDTTDDTAECSFAQQTGTGAVNYLVHEVAPPAGYVACGDDAFAITYSSTAQSHTTTCLNTPGPRDVVVKKVDDESPAVGVGTVVFKAVLDSGDDSTFGEAERTAYADVNVKQCTTATTGTAKGTCTLTGLDAGPGIHWYIVEDSHPAGYGDDTSKAVCTTVAADVGPPVVDQVDRRCVRIAVPSGSGSIPVSSDTTFTNPRLFKVIVLVCDKSTGRLYASNVAFDSETTPVTPNSLGHSATLPSGVTEANLCGLGGAIHDDVNWGTHSAPHINIPQ